MRLLFAGLLLCCIPGRGQDPVINRAKGLAVIEPVTCYIGSKPVTWPDLLRRLNENPRPDTFWLQAGLQNNSDTTLDLSVQYGELDFIDLYLYMAVAPGSPVEWVAGGRLRRSPPGASYAQKRAAFLPLRLAPHTSGRLVVRLRQLTDEYDFDGLTLYDPGTANILYVREMAENNSFLIVQMLFQGFLICQLLYMLFQWLMIRRPEYLYYFTYMLLIALYFLSKQESLFGEGLFFTRWPLLKVYFGKTLLILPYYVYFRFVRSFLEIPRDHPALNRWIIRMEYFLLAYAVFDLALIFITFDRKLQTEIYTVVFAAIFLLTIGFMVYMYRHRQTLVFYIISGSLFVATGHILGLTFSYLQNNMHLNMGVPDIFVFPQAGIVLEVICFTAGLSYKNQRTEMEKIAGQEKLIEQLKANEQLQSRMQHIRNKIAQDLHDDIGSTLSSISILSDLAIRENSGGQSIGMMNEIKDSSMLLMERMDDIVWSISPRNDSLENLLIRVRHFATTLFEAKGIDYTIDIQKNIGEVRLPMDYRQHIYLILKEAINNLVKYSQASQALIEVRFDEQHLRLSVRDNGQGFELSGKRDGNGLPGMRRRAELMKARVEVKSAPGAGTAIGLQVDIG
jgi:signal transduction histidine kinase